MRFVVLLHRLNTDAPEGVSTMPGHHQSAGIIYPRPNFSCRTAVRNDTTSTAAGPIVIHSTASWVEIAKSVMIIVIEIVKH